VINSRGWRGLGGGLWPGGGAVANPAGPGAAALVVCAWELFRQNARIKEIPAMIKVLLFISILLLDYGHFSIPKQYFILATW
jgi:hypothetical protein